MQELSDFAQYDSEAVSQKGIEMALKSASSEDLKSVFKLIMEVRTKQGCKATYSDT